MLAVRNLQLDLDDIERTAHVLDEVSLLDDAIKEASSNFTELVAERDRTEHRRKEMERIVRNVMPFDRVTYSTLANYEASVLAEVSKRMQATEPHVSRILTNVVDVLVRTGVSGPGDLPDIITACDEKREAEKREAGN